MIALRRPYAEYGIFSCVRVAVVPSSCTAHGIFSRDSARFLSQWFASSLLHMSKRPVTPPLTFIFLHPYAFAFFVCFYCIVFLAPAASCLRNIPNFVVREVAARARRPSVCSACQDPTELGRYHSFSVTLNTEIDFCLACWKCEYSLQLIEKNQTLCVPAYW